PVGVSLQPCAELALLALDLSPLALDLGAAALESLCEILQARLFGPRTHHRVLRLLHRLFEGDAGPAELVEPRLAALSLGLTLGLLAHQTLHPSPHPLHLPSPPLHP